MDELVRREGDEEDAYDMEMKRSNCEKQQYK